ncbi:MAG TPA: 50S ribosomal protein L30 [Chloroflexota bacterium]|nr:50S ribosomal protein L30 [Chloroflexota bacterium]
MPESQARLRIELVRSPIGYTSRQKATARALGLRRLHQVVERPDNQAVRGMIFKIQHLLRVETAPTAPEPQTGRQKPAASARAKPEQEAAISAPVVVQTEPSAAVEAARSRATRAPRRAARPASSEPKTEAAAPRGRSKASTASGEAKSASPTRPTRSKPKADGPKGERHETT